MNSEGFEIWRRLKNRRWHKINSACDFNREVLECKIEGSISNRLGEGMIWLANKTFTRKWGLDGYPNFKEDMINHAVMQMVMGYRSVKPAKGSAFVFFATVAGGAFCNELARQIRQSQIKETLLDQLKF